MQIYTETTFTKDSGNDVRALYVNASVRTEKPKQSEPSEVMSPASTNRERAIFVPANLRFRVIVSLFFILKNLRGSDNVSVFFVQRA